VAIGGTAVAQSQRRMFIKMEVKMMEDKNRRRGGDAERELKVQFTLCVYSAFSAPAVNLLYAK
jgi:hypothetical protein